mmetsp:Transcript_26101/g.57022  ORF Transcript_26101/g.57022 Transcript_26101/m.57022 type:complete len:291 (-) Transcript_26101:591-1463(-)
MSSLRVRPRVSWASSTVRSRPGLPLKSRCCMGALLSGPQPPPRPRLRTRSRSSRSSSRRRRSESIWDQPPRFQMLPERSKLPPAPPSSASSPSNALPALDKASMGACHCTYSALAKSMASRRSGGTAGAALLLVGAAAAGAWVGAGCGAAAWGGGLAPTWLLVRAARCISSSRRSSLAVLNRLPFASRSRCSASSCSPLSALWYLCTVSSTLRSRASLTAGYLRARRATPSLDSTRTSMVASGSSGQCSSATVWPAANGSDMISWAMTSSSGSRPRSRAARHVVRPRAAS